MAVAVLVGGQGFQEVFPEHGEGLQQCRPRDATPDADALGGKRLRGGHPAQMGSRAYRCLPGGPGTQRVARRGKSALCWRCAKVSGDAGGAQGGPRLQAGVSSRPRGLTVPEVGSTPWYPNAQAWRSPCLTGGVQCGEDCLSPVSGKTLKGGDSVVLQPPGRKGPSHPPRPRLATSGGGDAPAKPGGHGGALPSPMLPKHWPGRLWRWGERPGPPPRGSAECRPATPSRPTGVGRRDSRARGRHGRRVGRRMASVHPSHADAWSARMVRASPRSIASLSQSGWQGTGGRSTRCSVVGSRLSAPKGAHGSGLRGGKRPRRLQRAAP